MNPKNSLKKIQKKQFYDINEEHGFLRSFKNPKNSERSIKTKQKPILLENLNFDENCPVEDPRNPYHQEYLLLKAKRDGTIKTDGKFTLN